MRTRQVRWFEGMVVLPHHFQAAEANLRDTIATGQDWLIPFGYGIQSLQLQDEALANYEVRVSHLAARMRDGTLVSVPGNGQLDEIDLRSEFDRHHELYIHLLLPHTVQGRPNSTFDGKADRDRRYYSRAEDWHEQNHGSDSRQLDLHHLNVSLRSAPTLAAPPGYDSLPLLKLRRSQQPGAAPELDRSYIPPLLCCRSCPQLQQDKLLAIFSQLGAYIKKQSVWLDTQGGWWQATLPQVHRGIAQMQAANASYTVLRQLFEANDLHPYHAYLELCRLVGQLSIVRNEWQPPDLPIYNHDDLAGVFGAIQLEIDAILKDERTVTVQRIPFIGTANWMEVSLKPEWLQREYESFIGIGSDCAPDKLDELFADHHLDWKLGSRQTILRIYQNAEAGLRMRRFVDAHPGLPRLPDVTYYRVENNGPYWDELANVSDLALKVNQRFVREQDMGGHTMTVFDQNENAIKLRFELFLVRNG